MGWSTNETIQSLVQMEAEKYADIIQEDFIDAYKNLTLKVRNNHFYLGFATEYIYGTYICTVTVCTCH